MGDPLRISAGIDVLGALVLLLALPFCAGAAAAEKQRRLTPGNWGGNHVGMEVTEAGAKLDYDCAHGSIEQAIVLDERGGFEMAGTYARDGPGPTQPGASKGEPARYRGHLEGETLTLTVKLGSGEDVGTYTLVLGRFPRIRKCG